MYKALILISILIIITTLYLARPHQVEKIFYIWTGDRKSKQISLNSGEKMCINIEGKIGVSILEISNGRVHMVESPCDDKICVSLGWIKEQGEAICCVANQVLVKIAVKGKGAYDAISR